MADTKRVLFTTKVDLRTLTDSMRRDVAVAYERLKTLEVECLKEIGPIRHLGLELESQADCMNLIFEDLVHGERRVRSRLFELSSELYELQNSRSGGPFDLDAQQRDIAIRVASINVLHDRIHALKTNDEFSDLLHQSLDENGKILQTARDVSQIGEIRDRISRVRHVHVVSVKRLNHAYNRNCASHSREVAHLHQTVSDRRRHVQLLRQSIPLLFPVGSSSNNLLELVQNVSICVRNIARTRDMFCMYDANATRLGRLQARQSGLSATYHDTWQDAKRKNASRMGDSFPAI